MKPLIALILGLIGSGALLVFYRQYKNQIKLPPLKTFRKEYIDGVGARLKESFGADHKSFDLNGVSIFEV